MNENRADNIVCGICVSVCVCEYVCLCKEGSKCMYVCITLC